MLLRPVRQHLPGTYCIQLLDAVEEEEPDVASPRHTSGIRAVGIVRVGGRGVVGHGGPPGELATSSVAGRAGRDRPVLSGSSTRDEVAPVKGPGSATRRRPGGTVGACWSAGTP